MLQLESVYHQLLDHYGPQGWWPLYHTAKAPAYSAPRSRRPKNPEQQQAQQFEIALGAILTQSTSWSNVVLALTPLFQAGYLDLKNLASAPVDQVARLIRPVGYFNQKARYLNEFCAFLTKHPFTELTTLPTAQARSLLLSVRGIGPETADCILLYGLGKRSFVVDAYSRRIFSALQFPLAQAPYSRLAHWITSQLPPDLNLFQEFHALLVAHGKKIYSKKPYPALDPVLRSR